MIINLDSEDEGQFFIGCASGKDTVATIECEYEDVKELENPDVKFYKVMVKGLQGGHSGDDINKGRGNAVKLLTRLLYNGYCDYNIRIADIQAGNLRNAIAREGFAVVAVPADKCAEWELYCQAMNKIYKDEFHTTDPDVEVTLESAPATDKVLFEFLQIDLLNALMVCPHGVQAMSQDIPGFVETSTNLASVKKIDDKIVITTSQRSSVESRKEAVVDKVSTAFWMIGAEVVSGDGYPGWTPNPDSQVLHVWWMLTRTFSRKILKCWPSMPVSSAASSPKNTRNLIWYPSDRPSAVYTLLMRNWRSRPYRCAGISSWSSSDC